MVTLFLRATSFFPPSQVRMHTGGAAYAESGGGKSEVVVDAVVIRWGRYTCIAISRNDVRVCVSIKQCRSEVLCMFLEPPTPPPPHSISSCLCLSVSVCLCLSVCLSLSLCLCLSPALFVAPGQVIRLAPEGLSEVATLKTGRRKITGNAGSKLR